MEHGGSRKQRAAAGFVTGVVQLGVQLLALAALTPAVLHFAGPRVLGAYGVLAQAVAYLWLLDFGFGVAFGRYLTQAAASLDDPTRFRRVAGTGLAFYLVSNGVVALAAIGLSVGVVHAVAVDAQMLGAVRASLVLVAVWAIVRTPLNVYGAALIAFQDLATANIALALGAVLRLVLSLAMLAAGAGLVGLIAAQLVAEAAVGLIQWWRYASVLRGPPIRLREASRPAFREMFIFGGQYLLSAITVRLVYSTDQLIVARVAGLSAAAIYYTTQMPAFMLVNIIWKLADNALPAFNELHARKDREGSARNFVRVSKYSVLLAVGAALGILAFNRAVVTVWVGAEQYAGALMTGCLAAFAVFAVVNHVLALMLVVHGRVTWMSIAGFVSGVANVALSFVLGRRIGIAGVMLATVLVEALGTVLFLPYVLRLVGLKVSSVAKAVLPPAAGVAAFTTPALVGVILTRGRGWLVQDLALLVAFAALWTAGVWLVALDASERREARLLLGRFGARMRRVG